MKQLEIDKTYHIGDGVYVTWDGYHLVLRANSHLDPHPIYLDDSVRLALAHIICDMDGYTVGDAK